jgi:hypothetical protein
MNIERDKFLTEAMGEEWFEHRNFCGSGDTMVANDFSTWEGFGKLWEWAQKQEWWVTDFKDKHFGMLPSHFEFVPDGLVQPDRFATAIYAFLKERERG